MIGLKHAGSPPKIWLLALTILSVCLTSVAFGQNSNGSSTDTSYYVGYFGNANIPGFPDGRLDIINTGSTGGYSRRDGKTPIGDLCANIYVFTSDQQMVECCSCFVSPNGHIQLSLNLNLTSNPLTTLPVNAGALKIVSSNTTSGGACNVGIFSVAATNYVPFGELRAWNTHVRQTIPPVGTTPALYTVTETPLRLAYLKANGSEISKLQSQCFSVQTLGSGHGRCTCGGVPQ